MFETSSFVIISVEVTAGNITFEGPLKFFLDNRPYSEQRHDRYESEAVRDRFTVFPMASAVKS